MAFMKPLLILMNTPSDIFADAYSYIMIVSGGILAQMLYNLLSSILRALGNSKLPLVFLIISRTSEHCSGSCVYRRIRDGSEGSRSCDGYRTGRFRNPLPVLYHCEDSDPSFEA